MDLYLLMYIHMLQLCSYMYVSARRRYSNSFSVVVEAEVA
jgi:hypothetical protein